MTENPDPSAVLKKATLRSAEALGLTRKQLSLVLNTDEQFWDLQLTPDSSTGLRAQKIILIYRYLHALIGDNHAAVVHWMTTPNKRFGSSPLTTILSDGGLDQVISYLSALSE